MQRLPEYLKITDVYNQLEELRATSAMPFASKIIKINNKKYLDGGISDSIPIDKCKSLGYKKAEITAWVLAKEALGLYKKLGYKMSEEKVSERYGGFKYVEFFKNF